MSIFADVNSNDKSIVLSIWGVCAVVAVIAICLCVNCTVTDMNPLGRKKDTTPTTAVKLVPEQ